MRHILITGCSSGIGHALAVAFQEQGDQVVATARNASSLADLAALGCETMALDVTDLASQTALLAQFEARQRPLDMLINNAGITKMGPLVDLPIDKLRAQLETNTIAPISLIQRCLPLLRQSQQPMIVNIGSVSGILTTPFAGAYCASKAALHALTDALRMELKPFGVQVVNIQPGAIESKLGDNGTAGIDEWLSEDGLYTDYKDAIYARAVAQQQDCTPAAEFAQAVVKALAVEQPAAEIRIGNKSTLLPLLKRWLPTAKLDALLMKKFGLS